MSETNMRADKMLKLFEARAKQHLNALADGELSEGHIALDLMRSMTSFHVGGVPSEKVLSALPDASWRSDTMPVPVEFLKVLALAWGQYLEELEKPKAEQKSLAQCLGLERNLKSGAGPTKKARTRDRNQSLANHVATIILEAERDNEPVSQAEAIYRVAEERGVNPSTVKTAFHRYGRPHMNTYRSAHKQV